MPTVPEDDRQQPKQRKCLRCQELFLSAHAGNRICPYCVAHPPVMGGLRRVELDLDTVRDRSVPE